jgi:hypothetical protein
MLLVQRIVLRDDSTEGASITASSVARGWRGLMLYFHTILRARCEGL